MKDAQFPIVFYEKAVSTVDNASLRRLKPSIKIKPILPRSQIANGEL